MDRSARVAPVNATVRITLQHVRERPSKSGRELDEKGLAQALTVALGDPRAPRQVRPKRAVIPAAVHEKDLKNRYGTVVTISQSSFRLRLFKRLKFVESYGVAVGQPTYPRRGLFSVANKAVTRRGRRPTAHRPTPPATRRWRAARRRTR